MQTRVKNAAQFRCDSPVICALRMGVSERRFRVSMSESILPDFDWSAHSVEFCRIAVTESMKPHASSLSDPDAFEQWLQLPRHDVVVVQRLSRSTAEQ
jgi:hypothetical protein